MSNYVQADLDAIQDAIKKGVLRVEYNDRTVVFRSLKELLTIRELIRKDLGLSKKSGNRLLCKSSKGIF